MSLSTLRFYSTGDFQLLILLTFLRMMVEMQPQLSNEQKLLAIERRSACLENLINRPEASPTEYSKANKELRKITGSMKLINELRTKQKEIVGLKSLMAECPEDKDLLDMATEELNQAVEEEKKITESAAPIGSSIEKSECSKLSAGVSRLLAVVECEVVISLAVKSSCLVKVVFGFCLSGLLSLSYGKGTGGEDASLSAMDIFKMYERYSQKKGWKFDVIDVTESDLRGYKEASAAISGAGVVSMGSLNLRVEFMGFRSGDSGGQHANTTNSAVRITHIPTGMTVSIQDERSQHMNKAKALKLLRAKLYEMERLRIQMSRSKLRSEQIGSGDRSELIRTYNFPQGRVMDRCISITHHAINDVM
ncbi:hypothetical protein Patl1_19379 [Pistacia atlantica]|uniref:Uncharacterized protein n=1 Tax=Pistacia atlantica TaxID=434234 RepID=A0ACC1BZX2_9ROSI|nr:hypothetical protein Patl1_19379 [Pistacia atlantica]